MQRFNLLIVEPLQHTLKRHIQQADHLFCGGNIDLKSFAIIAHIGQHVCYIDISVTGQFWSILTSLILLKCMLAGLLKYYVSYFLP